MLRLFAGNSNKPLATSVAAALGRPLNNILCDRFPDGEIKVRILDDVRGADVFVIQSTNSNDALMELLIIADALRRASANRITAVLPYFGYARQDRKHEGRVPITAKLVANLIVTSGIERLLTIDLHAMQIQGFFDIPVDHLGALPVQLEYLRSLELEKPIVMCPDIGSIKIADAVARRLGFPLAILDKRRLSDSETSVSNVIGEIEGHDVIIVDDMISTAGSMASAVKTVLARGAKKVRALASHAVLCGDAYNRLETAGLTELAFTDTVPMKKTFQTLPTRILPVSGMLAEAIRRIHNNQSVSTLFV
jgi:ribose-phosphate pyrophosphokinase